MLRSLVGSEMCIRDRYDPEHFACTIKDWLALAPRMAPKTSPELSGNKIDHGSGATAWQLESASPAHGSSGACLLYTSDAADEEDSVDLGGRRIIKKKKKRRKKR
eukprot:TRINITY_DN3756_c0_g1_i1.p1 TRINITY_DN3756_c0_g1~~TRINITY_DN3756_c0_g1_i1.p1  ORF type:complete len:105 (-),score=37.24 TRINITY_DN3756_c0_g1_i1:109-423(-)